MKYTHNGNLVGSNSCAPENYKRPILLRETKNFWVSSTGTKYSKNNYGYPASIEWPMYKLDLESIKEIEK